MHNIKTGYNTRTRSDNNDNQQFHQKSGSSQSNSKINNFIQTTAHNIKGTFARTPTNKRMPNE